jgi:hypothetical protein
MMTVLTKSLCQREVARAIAELMRSSFNFKV